MQPLARITDAQTFTPVQPRSDARTPVDVPMLLAATHEHLTEFQVTSGMDALCDGLAKIRRELPPPAWARVAREGCRSHPVRRLIHEAPVSRRAFAKPRGYAGDAETLDLIYGCGPLPHGLSALAAALYGYELQMDAATTVRARCDYLATLIDEVAEQTPQPRVLSVACGHLREAERSVAVRERRLGAFYALDQDEQSLEWVDREHAGRGVQTVHASVRSVLKGVTTFSGLDLIYAAGLYDYLELPVATSLTATLFGMLREGGRLLVANFAPNLRDAAYMEAFMDWTLIYRDEAEFERVADLVPADLVAWQRLFRDRTGNVVFLELRRC